MEENKNNLTKNQKLALTGLTIFTILIIGLWVVNLNKEIKGPLPSDDISGNASSTASSTADLANETLLKSQDTDGDGLSDWDELNVYHTSPYLEDSDSDGIPDGIEVKNGTDPNCPQGKDCSISKPISGTASSTAPISSAPVVAPAATPAGTSGTATSSAISSSTAAEIQTMVAGKSDAASLRKLLLDSGVKKTDLDQMSDQQLLQMYQDLLSGKTPSGL